MAGGNISLSSETPQRKFRWRAVVVILGGILIHLTLGTFYTFGNFSPYIISYLRYRSGEKDLKNVDSLWVQNVGKVTQCIGMVVGGLIFKKFGVRIAAAVGCTIFSGSVFLSYFAVQKSFIAFVATYGVMYGLGTFATYAAPITSAVKWLPNNPGLAGGFIIAGFGGGAFIFNQVITQYINPHNKAPDVIEGTDRYFSDDDLLDRVPTCFLILGGIYSGMQIIGIILITSPPAEETDIEVAIQGRNGNYIKKEETQNYAFQPDVEDRHNPLDECNVVTTEMNGSIAGDDVKSHDAQIGDSPAEHIHPKESTTFDDKTEGKSEFDAKGHNSEQTVLQIIMITLKSRNFYVWLVVLLCMDSGIGFVTNLYKSYGQTFIQDDHFLAIVGSCSSIFNCIGRICWGAFMDRFTFKITLQCVTAIFASFVATIIASEWGGEPFFFVWVCALYMSFSGMYATLPGSLSNLYGADNIGINYGLVSSVTILSGIGTALLGSSVKSLIGWHGIFLLSSGIVAIGFIASFFFNDRQVKRR
ncbi:hypothetical protein ACJMK2_019426 [Sinanodonta woodiana]|uniref:Major facilitator superfamily (MFS) profile domain-containing protein n=1 Tax=Sinanodonta woodiana TaxID=1069815 RepID=A0ABD3UHY0_SINWO